ncbi:hypothetical protein C8R43DRAFT_1120846 [Mycena crocata]|nr:hypothetical protein C8R43DRAFT_1120846 [Mycena crocata]
MDPQTAGESHIQATGTISYPVQIHVPIQLAALKAYIAMADQLDRERKMAHENTLDELYQEIRELKYKLSVAKGDIKDLEAKVPNKEPTGTVNEQLAEVTHFIVSIGGILEDGAQKVIENARQRIREAEGDA